MLFNRRKARPQFIQHPLYHPKDHYIGDLYELVYFPPLPLRYFTVRGVTEPCPTLYAIMRNIFKQATWQLYQIPAVRSYYGADFLHGVTTRYDRSEALLVFENLDDTEEAEGFTKEAAVILSRVMENWLKESRCIVHYGGDRLKVMPVDEALRLEKQRKVFVNGYIAWDV